MIEEPEPDLMSPRQPVDFGGGVKITLACQMRSTNPAWWHCENLSEVKARFGCRHEHVGEAPVCARCMVSLLAGEAFCLVCLEGEPSHECTLVAEEIT